MSAGANFLLATAGITVASYYYYSGPALYSYLSAAALIYLVVASGPLVAVIGISFAYVQVRFNGEPPKPEVPAGEDEVPFNPLVPHARLSLY